MGTLQASLAPTERPTTADFYWAAGLFEGEGHARQVRKGYPGEQAQLGQKDPEVLYRVKALFGGNIYHYGSHCYLWNLSGARARGFLMSIYGLLSHRRQEQIRKAMCLGEFA